MSNLDSFIFNSDYSTFKNDDDGIVTVAIPAGQTIPASSGVIGDPLSYLSFSSTVNIGSSGAFFSTKMNPSQDPGVYYLGSYFALDRITPPDAFDNPFSVIVLCRHTSGNTFFCEARARNPYALDLPLGSYTETFSFNIKTYLAPFN